MADEFSVVSRTTAVRDIEGAFRNLEAFLVARPWRDHGEMAELQRARRMVELLVNGQVAVVNQYSPDEYAQKVQEVERLTDTVVDLRLRLSEANRGWAERVATLEVEVRGLTSLLGATQRTGEYYHRVYNRATARLRKARADRRKLRATMVAIGELVVARLDWGGTKEQAAQGPNQQTPVQAAAQGGPEAGVGVGPGLRAAEARPLLRPGGNKPPRGLA